MIDTILTDLKGKFGDRVLLSPSDIADIIGVSVGEQANQRSKGSFPIPWNKDMGRVKISIYDLANYLSGCSRAHSRGVVRVNTENLTRAAKKALRGNLEEEWWLFRVNPIFSILTRANLSLNLEQKPYNKQSKV